MVECSVLEIKDRVIKLRSEGVVEGQPNVTHVYGYNNELMGRQQHLWYDRQLDQLSATGPSFVDEEGQLIVLDEEAANKTYSREQSEFDYIVNEFIKDIDSYLKHTVETNLDETLKHKVLKMFSDILAERNSETNHQLTLLEDMTPIHVFEKEGRIIVGMLEYKDGFYEAWSYNPTTGFYPENELNLIYEFLEDTIGSLDNFANKEQLIEGTSVDLDIGVEHEFSGMAIQSEIETMMENDVKGEVRRFNYEDKEGQAFMVYLEITEDSTLVAAMEFEDPIYDEGTRHVYDISGDDENYFNPERARQCIGKFLELSQEAENIGQRVYD